MPSYYAERLASASPSTIWQLLVDAHSWPTWTPIDELVMKHSEGLSADRRTRVGAVQAFRTGDAVTSERITELVPERRFCYEDASNAFLYNYRAVVELSPSENGTTISWRGVYDTHANLEAVLPDYLQGFMQQHVDGLAARAESGRTPQPSVGDDGVVTISSGAPPTPVGDDRRRRRFVLLAGLASALLIPWIVVLALVLPRRFVASHWTLTWVGFDVGLLVALAATTVFAARRSRRVVPAASVAAGLLCGDAWFDVTTSHPGGLAVSVASAVVVELPLAVLLLYVADLVLRLHAVWPDERARPRRRTASRGRGGRRPPGHAEASRWRPGASTPP